jgi:hypothetical protein
MSDVAEFARIHLKPGDEPAAMALVMRRCDILAERIEWPGYSRMAMLMDMENVNTNIVRLDYAALAKSGDGDFAHDVIGIWNHYNRVTGKLERCFLPRCAKLETATN